MNNEYAQNPEAQFRSQFVRRKRASVQRSTGPLNHKGEADVATRQSSGGTQRREDVKAAMDAKDRERIFHYAELLDIDFGEINGLFFVSKWTERRLLDLKGRTKDVVFNRPGLPDHHWDAPSFRRLLYAAYKGTAL